MSKRKQTPPAEKTLSYVQSLFRHLSEINMSIWERIFLMLLQVHAVLKMEYDPVLNMASVYAGDVTAWQQHRNRS